jgi:hypothetical protein
VLHAPADPKRGELMCKKCEELETAIQHYRRLVAQCLDHLTIERANALIHELQERKEAMRH